MKIKILTLSLLLLFIATFAFAGEVNEKIIDTKKACVAVIYGKVLGSGFFINEQGYFITAAHVIVPAIMQRRIDQGTYEVLGGAVKTNDGQLYKFKLILDLIEDEDFYKTLDSYLEHDYFICKAMLEGDPISYLKLADSREVKDTQDCYSIGTPNGIENLNTAVQGKISNIRHDHFTHSADINHGFSGGPLVNEDGAVIGVNIEGQRNELGKVDALDKARKINFVKDELRKRNIKYYTDAAVPSEDNVDISEQDIVLEKKGETSNIDVKITPKDSILTWSSSNPKVATVEKGTVKAVGRGTCVITAKNEKGKFDTCNVTVNGIDYVLIAIIALGIIFIIVIIWVIIFTINNNNNNNKNGKDQIVRNQTYTSNPPTNSGYTGFKSLGPKIDLFPEMNDDWGASKDKKNDDDIDIDFH